MSDQSITAIAFVIQNEGSAYVNNPADRGGPCKFGITIPDLTSWRGHAQTTADIANLKVDEARQFYQTRYYDALKLDRIGSQSVATSVLDMAVLTGTQTATRMLQRALGIAEDGQFGPLTVAAVNGQASRDILPKFAQCMQMRFLAIVRADASQSRFLWGWLCRSTKILMLSL